MSVEPKRLRKILDDHSRAHAVIDRLGVVIDVLENMPASTRSSQAMAQRCIAQCKREQQVQLRKLDAAAAKLGAPYYGTSL